MKQFFIVSQRQMEPKSLGFQCFLSIMLTQIPNLGEAQGGEVRTCILSFLPVSLFLQWSIGAK